MLKGIELPRVDTGSFDFGNKRVATRKAPDGWEGWLRALFPEYVAHPFAEHHTAFWRWAWSIRVRERPRPFVAIWPRGHGKSTNAEMAVVALGARGVRRYALYVCGTQDQADDHVQNVADMLESEAVAAYYPELSKPKVGKYGNSRGWRRNRLRTASGFTVDAIGLDSAARGAKVEEDRPGLIVVDDVDGENDSEKVVEKKIRSLTRKILPAGAENLAVLAVQNLVHANSIFSRLVDGRADFLSDRVVSGPIPAIEDFAVEDSDGRHVIVSGEPTWEGMGLERCQEILDDEGLRAFLSERMHLVRDPEDAIFEREWWEGTNRYEPAAFGRQVLARWLSLDLAMKDKQTSAYNAMTVFELANPGYYLDVRSVWREKLSFPKLMPRLARMAERWNFDGKLRGVIIEDKAHGITAIQTIEAEAEDWLKGLVVPFSPAGASKEQRWQQAASWCQRGCVRLPEPSAQSADLYDFEEELYALPQSAYNDWADAFSQGVIFLEHVLARGFEYRRRYGDAA